ncbi:hypothetical protein EASAB2608_00316 [Streptomyces sp. EAS-AB2608]|uniref:Uncharacterized protein n=1 Tax=Streptomyces bangladeshensis TaxID=295352 RepID=A0ABP5N8J0_9ACTN|nr:hypothetical protein EASAB2608_00316 [Streptomyces sp. EAS-AB2608]
MLLSDRDIGKPASHSLPGIASRPSRPGLLCTGHAHAAHAHAGRAYDGSLRLWQRMRLPLTASVHGGADTGG